jgi:hypothetical protein
MAAWHGAKANEWAAGSGLGVPKPHAPLAPARMVKHAGDPFKPYTHVRGFWRCTGRKYGRIGSLFRLWSLSGVPHTRRWVTVARFDGATSTSSWTWVLLLTTFYQITDKCLAQSPVPTNVEWVLPLPDCITSCLAHASYHRKRITNGRSISTGDIANPDGRGIRSSIRRRDDDDRKRIVCKDSLDM